MGVGNPEDEEEAVITDVPLFERIHAPRTRGSGPGLVRSVIENDFDRGLDAGLALLELTAPLRISPPLLRTLLLDVGRAASTSGEVEDSRPCNCSSALTASAAAVSERVSSVRLDSC